MPTLTCLPTSRTGTFASLMQRLGEVFYVRDVMIELGNIEYVKPHDLDGAAQLVSDKRYSVVPASEDGRAFDAVFDTRRPIGSTRVITNVRNTSLSDYIPDSTPLAEALGLFENREWYLTIRGNQVSGLATYWIFNYHEFRVQLYVALSHLEALSRDVLAKDGCGTDSEAGLRLTNNTLAKARTRFESSLKGFGGNRFVDELDFHNVHDALKKHQPWRQFLDEKNGESISTRTYESLYTFTKLRDSVMHGRLLFPTYEDFKQGTAAVNLMIRFIDLLTDYGRFA